MPGLLSRSSARRAVVPSLAIAGVGAAVALAAAVPAGAAAPSHHSRAEHHRSAEHHRHASHHMKHLSVKGLVADRHGRTVTVFAKSAKAGETTHHNRRVKLTFARSVHARVKMPVGDRIRVAGVGHASRDHFTIVRHNDETVTAAPASLFFGTVQAINGNLLTVSERDRDNGDHERGGDRHRGHDGMDNDARTVAHDHGGDGGNSGPGHRITVDDSNADITVAAQIFGFNNAPAFVRGDITAIDGNNVTVGDDDNQGDDVAHHHSDGGDDNDDAITVSLAGVPLVVNGDSGASVSDLSVGDKLVLLGSFDSSGGFTPSMGFAFNGDDNQPCGHNDDNDQGDDHGHHDGGDDHGHDG
jgi:hypothetical protein